MTCPTFIVGTIAYIAGLCLTQEPTTCPIDTGCPTEGLTTQYYGTTIQFTSNFTTTYIGVDSDINYDFAPNGSVYIDFLIMDACDGEVIFNTWNFTPCEVGQDLIFASSPMPWTYDYWVELTLEPGNDYIMLTGAIGLENIQDNLEGCYNVTIISDLLGLTVEEHYNVLDRIKKNRRFNLFNYNVLGQKL
jgi:hypothetical protein